MSGTTEKADLNPAEAEVMRAIAAREHRRALDDRRAARAAHAASAGDVPASTAGWSRKPTKADIEAENAAATRRSKRRLVPADRALRERRRAIETAFDHKREGTPQTHAVAAAQTREGSLARLWKTGAITDDQLAAAVDIASVAERIGADVSVRTASLETRIDAGRRGDGTFYERLGQVRREFAYSRWRSAVRGPIAAILDMIVGDTVGITVVARRYGVHHRTARSLLTDALDLWPEMLGHARRCVDERTLEQAHAELLG